MPKFRECAFLLYVFRRQKKNPRQCLPPTLSESQSLNQNARPQTPPIDVSVGSFRAPKDYLKKMRKQYPDSAVVQFPITGSKQSRVEIPAS